MELNNVASSSKPPKYVPALTRKRQAKKEAKQDGPPLPPPPPPPPSLLQVPRFPYGNGRYFLISNAIDTWTIDDRPGVEDAWLKAYRVAAPEKPTKWTKDTVNGLCKLHFAGRIKPVFQPFIKQAEDNISCPGSTAGTCESLSLRESSSLS